MTDCDIVEWMGGTSRCTTFITFLIHFIHPLLCIINYCAWVRYQIKLLDDTIVNAYLAMSIVATLFYLFVASVFYMWAWRYPEPEEVSKRRRIYGMVVNLFFSDLPIFIIEVEICWRVQIVSGIQGTSFVVTCISLAYSLVRVWVFLIIKLIKIRAPMVGAPPQLAGAAYSNPGLRQQGQVYPSSYGNSASREGAYTDNGGRSGNHIGAGSYSGGVTTPDDTHRRGNQYIDDRYSGGQYSTPGHRIRPLY